MKAEYVIGLVLLGFIVGVILPDLGAVSPLRRRSDRKRPAAPSSSRKTW